jgi:protein-tyrosine phosphatase
MRSLLASAQLGHRVSVESAGTQGHHQGELPDRRSRAAAQRRKIELSSRARQFTSADWQRFDYVLAMDRQNFEHLAASAPNAATTAKLRLFRDFDPAAPAGAEVPDPYYGGPEGFEHVLDLCQAAAEGLLRHLRQEHGL